VRHGVAVGLAGRHQHAADGAGRAGVMARGWRLLKVRVHVRLARSAARQRHATHRALSHPDGGASLWPRDVARRHTPRRGICRCRCADPVQFPTSHAPPGRLSRFAARGVAMAGAPPPLSSPWLTRADEVSPHDPRVAYYLRMHAAEEGLRSGAAPAALATLLARLEKDKPRAGLESRAADAAHCAAFADKVFARADAKACARCACRWCLKDASGHRTLIERRCAVLMWS
jgi:hypothetical protein